jgi:omega-6 fatty acid desaturase (delta-12 desaturase)
LPKDLLPTYLYCFIHAALRQRIVVSSTFALENLPPTDARDNHATSGIATRKRYPTKREVLAVIPKECFDRSLFRSSLSLFLSLAMTLGSGALAYACIPLSWSWLPAWIAYAIVAGTAGTGCWVVAHECGHRAFAKYNWLQDAIGYCLHSGLLVPYFSWQRSHAVHHARTNHLDFDETHVPLRDTTPGGAAWRRWQETFGDEAFAIIVIVLRFLVGWPLYLLTGVTGGPARGLTNHFWPGWPFSTALFPGEWRRKVWLSDIGVVVMLGLLGWWTYSAGFLPVLAVYAGPYLVVNVWLVLYTWLQHTDVDIPHFDDEDWTWVKGAFMTVDRPYGGILDFMHHHIGSTHVAHHMDARIPHYHAVKATRALRENFPDLYRHDPTPIPKALWRVATRCQVVSRGEECWSFAPRRN